jgi:hypothetical protein
MWNLYSPEPLMRGRLMTRRGPVTAKPVISTADPDDEGPNTGIASTISTG